MRLTNRSAVSGYRERAVPSKVILFGKLSSSIILPTVNEAPQLDGISRAKIPFSPFIISLATKITSCRIEDALLIYSEQSTFT